MADTVSSPTFCNKYIFGIESDGIIGNYASIILSNKS